MLRKHPFPANNTELDPETTDFTVRRLGKGSVIDIYVQSRLKKADLLSFLAKGGKLGKKLVLSDAGKGQWKLGNRLSGETVATISEVTGNGGLVINVNFHSEDFDGGPNAENEIRKRFLIPANQTIHFIESEIGPPPPERTIDVLRPIEFVQEVRQVALDTIAYVLTDPPRIPGASPQAVETKKNDINALGLRIRHLGTEERPEVSVDGKKIKTKTIVKLFTPGDHRDQVTIAFARSGEEGNRKQWTAYELYRNPEFDKYTELLRLITGSP